jgi:hypothetical protein
LQDSLQVSAARQTSGCVLPNGNSSQGKKLEHHAMAELIESAFAGQNVLAGAALRVGDRVL